MQAMVGSLMVSMHAKLMHSIWTKNVHGKESSCSGSIGPWYSLLVWLHGPDGRPYEAHSDPVLASARHLVLKPVCEVGRLHLATCAKVTLLMSVSWIATCARDFVQQ